LDAKLITDYDTKIKLLEHQITLLQSVADNNSETNQQKAYKAGMINEINNRIFKIKIDNILYNPKKIIKIQEPFTIYETYKLRKWAITFIGFVFSFFAAVMLVFAYNLIKSA